MRLKPRRLLDHVAVGTALVLAASVITASGPAQASTADPKATINWWTWNPDITTGATFVKAFEKEHPNIKVKQRFLQYSVYTNAVRLAATSKSGPDVFGLQTGAMTTQFAPLVTNLSPLAATGIGKDWKSKLITTNQFVVGSKQVALPWMISAAGELWYNKTILDKAGVTPPTNLADWKADCTKIEALGVTCFVQGAKDDWVNLDVYQAIINQITPGIFYKAMLGKTSFAAPAFVQAFNIWKSLFDDGVIQKGALGIAQYPDANDMFVKGQAAMIAFGAWNKFNDDDVGTRNRGRNIWRGC